MRTRKQIIRNDKNEQAYKLEDTYVIWAYPDYEGEPMPEGARWNPCHFMPDAYIIKNVKNGKEIRIPGLGEE